MDVRISVTKPDARLVKLGRRRTPSPHFLPRSSHLVRERKKMFEQTDSAVVIQTAAPPSSNYLGTRRGSKPRKEMSRTSSFRGPKGLRGDESRSPDLSRSKSMASSNMTAFLWKKLRNFGHYDVQSMVMESLATTAGSAEEHNVKKPTGASAAQKDSGLGIDGGMCNALIASCAAFTNEVGGDNDWLAKGNPVFLVRDCLSVDKKRRVSSRERMILDGEVPLKSMMHTRGPMNKQVGHILQPRTGLTYPLEFIDYGASYYRNYFLDHGKHM